MRQGLNVKAYTVSTAFQLPRDTADALRLARELGADHELIEVYVLRHADICANPPDRCYLCKRADIRDDPGAHARRRAHRAARRHQRKR